MVPNFFSKLENQINVGNGYQNPAPHVLKGRFSEQIHVASHKLGHFIHLSYTVKDIPWKLHVNYREACSSTVMTNIIDQLLPDYL